MLKQLFHNFLILTRSLIFWIGFDVVYIIIMMVIDKNQFLTVQFIISHFAGIVIATMVMFTGVGAGVLWVPILTFLNIDPSDAVSISIFTQIAGKGIGSFNYLREKMVDLSVVRYLIPYALLGTFLGYLAGYGILLKYKRLFIIIFVMVAIYLLIQMLKSLSEKTENYSTNINADTLRQSRFLAIVSSFFTGLLSIGNSDWLIPHMERHLKLPTSRAVATGLLIMFIVSVFYLFLSALSAFIGFRNWPAQSHLLFSTCSGVIVGGQIGTRLIRFEWLKKYQKHAFIIMLSLSIIHILW